MTRGPNFPLHPPQEGLVSGLEVVMDRKTRKNPLERYQEKPTYKSAVEAKCFTCVGSGADPYIEPIRTCSVTTCPLHPFRPYQ